MSGILARYLSGIGTDPLNQQGGMEGYLSQFNVNPYYQQFLQNGNQGLLAQQPQYTQGGQNPYYQAEQQPQAAPAKPAAPVGPVTISGFLGSDNPTQWSFNARQSGGRPQGVVFSNGQSMGIDDFREKAGLLGLLDGRFNLQKGFDVSKLFQGA